MSKIRGLGDILAFVLTPLQSLLRHSLHLLGVREGSEPKVLQKKSCGCKKRQEILNKMVPNPLVKTHRTLYTTSTHEKWQRRRRIGTDANKGQATP